MFKPPHPSPCHGVDADAPRRAATVFVAPAADPPAWPDTDALLAARGASGTAARLKTWWRHWRSRPHRVPLLRALQRHPDFAQRFAQDARYFHCAASHFVDRRLGVAQRITTMAADLELAGLHLPPGLAQRIGRGEQVRLWSLDGDLQLCLGWNDVSYHEGLWALSLRDIAGRRLYYLSFSFRPDGSVLVPTLQGPAGGDQDPRGLIRQLTKQAQGLRPQNLLMAALRAACAHWRIERLAGIDPAHHVKGRWNLRGSRLRFDYTGFWREQAGSPAADGHWTLPLTLPPRAAADIPAQKRAMYRRRQGLLDDLATTLTGALGGAAGEVLLAA